MITLRSNQSEPINKAIAFFNEKKPKPSLIVLPTAWGKSILTAFVAKNCIIRSKGHRTNYLRHYRQHKVARSDIQTNGLYQNAH